jgi:peptide/nickel transport system substrate-binding protein
VRSVRATPAHGLLAVAASALVALGGCGGDDPLEGSASSASATAGGSLKWGFEDRPSTIDPLLADTRSEQVVSRQIHEPLVATLAGPYGDVRRVPGLALSSSSAANDTVWSFRIRQGVRFQDGSPLNAGAVLANGRRWLTTEEGQAAMPNLFAVDAPRPDLVRFLLRAPDPSFPEVLSGPRTGIVAPRALDVRSGEGASLVRENRSGTGAFQLREQGGGEVLLVRNQAWWGTQRDLGPALDQIGFQTIADPAERLALLVAGDLQVADGLGAAQARETRRHPLVEALPAGDGEWLGLERSVRGISSGYEVPSLAGAWITTVGAR